ncbi:type II secretion system F family protein [Isosphaeraceae bacterium EP7]
MGNEARPGQRRRTSRKHGLQTLMLVIVYCALTFQIARPAVETGTPDAIALLAAWIGLGITLFGTLGLARASSDASRVLASFAIFLGIMLTCGSALGVFGLFVGLALVVALVAAIILGQRAESESLLWTIAIAARHGMPLADGVSAFARQSGRWGRARGLALSDRLREGIPLPQAMRMSKGLIPQEGVLAAAIGLETNTLAESLGEAAARLTGRGTVIGPAVRRLVYLGLLVVVGQSILGFLVYFILPKMDAVMRDFSMPMTNGTMLVRQGLGIVTGNQFTVLVPLAVQFGQLMLVAAGLLRLMGWRLENSWAFAWINPGRHSAVVMRSLALGIEAGQPLRETINSLRRWYPPAGVRRRLAGVDQGLERGGDWIELLRTTRFLRRVDCAVLESAVRAGNVPWALRTLAGQRERAFFNKLEFWTQVLFPLAMIAIGAGIMMVGMICYQPMVEIMEVLSKP